MRDETAAAHHFWWKWIWLEAWGPTMKPLKDSSLMTRAVCFAFVVGLSGLIAIEGYDKTADPVKWFLFNNVIGAIFLFVIVFAYNLFLAPGRLLVNAKVAEANRLIEAIRLGQDLQAAEQDFNRWRDETRHFFIANIPAYEQIFDDVEMGPFGPILDLPARLRAASSPGFQKFMESQPQDPRDTLIDMISRRKGNLQRISERLIPMSVFGRYE